jgi:uncharacterized membrane protein YhaH (DUF805 family)
MESPASLLSASGRIAPRPFALGAVAVYLLSFLSQILLSPPVTVRFGLAPFAILQGVLTWTWFALHAKRLRDAGRPIALAFAIAVLYALAMVLLLLLVDPMIGPGVSAVGTEVPRWRFADLWVFLLLLPTFTGPATLGFFDVLALASFVLIMVPMLMAIGFSIWAARQPSKAGASDP